MHAVFLLLLAYVFLRLFLASWYICVFPIPPRPRFSASPPFPRPFDRARLLDLDIKKFFFRSFSVLVEPPARSFDSNFCRPSRTFWSFSALDLRFLLASAMIESGLTAPLMRTPSSSSSLELHPSSLSSSNSWPRAMARFLRAASRGSRRALSSRSTSFRILAKSEAVKTRVDETSCFSLLRSSWVIFDRSNTPSSLPSFSPFFSLGSTTTRSGASSSSSSSTSFMSSSCSSSSSPEPPPSASRRSCSRS
mmetsp:Transcript_12769/g.27073  ORF Transcript_12769/g.27073 Transcript_12769/m.27073 type:complete len:250 (+) Transcript_12769:155-904(+)